MDPAVEMWQETMAQAGRGSCCRATLAAADTLYAAAMAGADYSRRFHILETGLSKIAGGWA